MHDSRWLWQRMMHYHITSATENTLKTLYESHKSIFPTHFCEGCQLYHTSITWKHMGQLVLMYMTSCISIAANHRPYNNTYTSRTAEPNWALVSCCRQETDGLLGKKKKSRKKACQRRPRRKRPSFLFCLHLSLHHPFILCWKEKEDWSHGGIRRLDQWALAHDKRDGVLWEIFK